MAAAARAQAAWAAAAEEETVRTARVLGVAEAARVGAAKAVSVGAEAVARAAMGCAAAGSAAAATPVMLRSALHALQLIALMVLMARYRGALVATAAGRRWRARWQVTRAR